MFYTTETYFCWKDIFEKNMHMGSENGDSFFVFDCYVFIDSFVNILISKGIKQ